jgi:hypothetical protein
MMKNPYLRKSQTASTLTQAQANQTTSFVNSPTGTTRTNNTINNTNKSINTNELLRAIQEYLQSKNGNGASNEMNMNTSFSVSSHAMRQRKLLRKVLFELQQLVPTSDGGADGDGGDGSDGSVRFTSFFIKCSSIHNVQLDPGFGFGFGSDENENGNTSNITELVLQVMDSVNATIVEEYLEQMEEEAQARLARERAEQPNINMNVNMNTTAWNDQEETSENLMAALEFLDAAYACLDPCLVYNSLMTLVDADAASGCVDMVMGMGADGENDTTYTIMDALLYFTAHSKQNQNASENGTTINTNTNTRTCRHWDRLQTLSLSVMTKGILCAEYIQKYCTSTSVLPADGHDSLLGRGMGMGLGLDNMKDCEEGKWVGVLERVIHALGMTKEEASVPGSKMDASFRLSCMALLSVYYRTKFIHVPLDLEIELGLDDKVVDRLYDDTQGLGDYLDGIGLDDGDNDNDSAGSGCASFATSVMALSLLTLIQSSSTGGTGTGVGVGNEEKLVIENDTMEKLFAVTFGKRTARTGARTGTGARTCTGNGNEPHRDVCIEGATDILIHLCSSRHDAIRRFVKTDSFGRIISEAVHENILSNDNGNGNDNDSGSMNARHSRGMMFAFIHLNEAAGPAFRKIIRGSMGGDSSANSRLVKAMLGMATDVSLTTPTLLFVKSLLLQSTVNGQWQLRDDLASATWNSIINEPVKIQTLISRFLSRYNQRANYGYVYVTLDLLEFLFRSAQFQTHCSKDILGDDTVAILVKMLKSSGTKETHRGLKCGLQLGAATLLSQKCLHHHQEGNVSAIKRLLNRFATNSLDDDSHSPRKSVKEGVIEYALNQAVSRDLTRRALNLQSILSIVGDEDSFDIASTIFDATVEKEMTVSSLMDRLAKQQEELEIMNDNCRELAKERNQLSDKLAKTSSSFQRDLKQKLSIARADAMDMAQVQADEKRELSQRMTSLQEQILHEQDKLERAHRDVEAEKLASRKMNEDLKSRIGDLEDQLASNQQRLETSKQECRDKDARLGGAASKLDDAKLALSRTTEENNGLMEENNSGKQKLEESLVQLISITQIYSSKEKEHNEECKNLRDRHREAKDAIEEEAVRRRRVEDKYSQLKEKYLDSKEKYENELKRRDEERRRGEIRKKDEERRREEMKRRDDEKRREERRKRSEDEKSSRRRQDGRKPMGTLDFMNSLHDTSMRSERSSSTSKNCDDSSLRTKKQSSRSDSRSSGGKRSGFRIVR